MTNTEEPWTATAFGLEISGSFPAPGLQDQVSPDCSGPARRVVLRMETSERLDRALVEADATSLYDREMAGARFRILWTQTGGFLLEHDHYGRFWVSAEGSQIGCVPRELDDWRWQRFLVGQVLPLAALLQGLEPLHASAVAIDGRAILCMGASGSGKTSTALHMASAGADLMTDDVAAIEVEGEDVVVHPGAPLTSLNATELDRLGRELPGGPLRPLGAEEGEIRLAVPALRCSSAPVGGVYVLTRRDEADHLTVEPLAGSWTAVLLGATFNAYAQRPGRLISQLDVCTRLAEAVPLWRVEAPPGSGAADVAHAILQRASGGA